VDWKDNVVLTKGNLGYGEPDAFKRCTSGSEGGSMEKCYQHWTGRVTRLLPTQPWCGLYLKDGDLIEVDHFIPKRLGGKDEISNLRAMHHHCHDQKSRTEGQKRDSPEETEALNDNEPD
jgi:hypothetical protein